MNRKTVIAAVAAATMGVGLAGCNTPGERATGGALLGAATGAAVGGATTGTASGAAVGAAVGGATGAVVGAATAPCSRYGYDRRGRRICIRR